MSIDQVRNAANHVLEPNSKLPLGARCFRWFRRWWILLFLLSASLIGIGFWKGGAIYHEIKVWRVHMLIATSKEALHRGDEPAAVDALHKAWALIPQNVPTVRAMAEFDAWKHDPSTLEVYESLIATGRASTEDWIQYTREAFRQQRQLDDARPAGRNQVDPIPRDLSRLQVASATLRGLNELSKTSENWNRPEVLGLRAQRKMGDGQRNEALDLARRAVAGANGEAREYAQLVLAQILLTSTKPESAEILAGQTEGMTILGEVASQPGRNGFEALEVLIQLTQRPDANRLFAGRDAEKWRQALNRHPHASEHLRAAAWNLPLAANPEAKATIAKDVSHYYSKAAPEKRLEGARWLNQHLLYHECISLLDDSKLASKDLLLVYLDALAGSGQWEKVATLVAPAAKVPLSPAVRRLFQYRATAELGQKPDASAAWPDIQRLLRQEKFENGLYVASYAEKIGFPSEAATIYRRMITSTISSTASSKQERLACHMGLIRSASTSMQLGELEEALAAFSREFPALPDVENDLTYVRLLKGSEMEKAQEAAGRLLRLRPDLLAYRTTGALAALKKGDADAALQIYAGWQIDWNTAPERFKAVYAAVLAAAGRSEQATAIRATIRSELLRPEERNLAGLSRL